VSEPGDPGGHTRAVVDDELTTPGPGPDGSNAADRTLSTRMARSASQLFIRKILIQVFSAAATAILARVLDVSVFGALSAGLATYYLLLSACDFGFGLVLARELGAGRADDGTLVRSMLQVQTLWSLAIGLGAIGVAVATGLERERADVLLALVPTIALAGVGGSRQIFYATYTTAKLGFIDVVSNIAQAVLIAAVALFTRNAIDVALVFSATILANQLIVLHYGKQLLDDGKATSAERRRLFRMSLPLGVGSLLMSAYFDLDLTIVAYLVSGEEVGYYAAATKALTVLVSIPGLVMTAALAGMSQSASSRESLGRLMARIWHWLAAIALPMCVGVIIFASPFVRLFFGPKYLPAIVLVRILAASAIVALLTNVFNNAMVATRRTRWLVVQGTLALVINAGGNLLLVPHFGVLASAWLTLATEAFVCAASILGLRGRVGFRPLLLVSRAPLVAVAALVAVGLPLAGHVFIGVPLAGAAFLVVLVLLRGWPEELRPTLPGRLSRPRPG
jgi:O-antigen/teichoic acid export membrane protein